MRRITTVMFIAASMPILAQERSLTCDQNRGSGNSRQERFCEMREYTIGAVPRLSADGRVNGGVAVKGWNRSDVLVRAKVEAWAPSEGEARAIAGQINVQSAGGNVRADAPEFGRDRGWAVSYEIFVPNRTDLNLKAHNGGISIADVQGSVRARSVRHARWRRPLIRATSKRGS